MDKTYVSGSVSRQQKAEILAATILNFIVSDPRALTDFLNTTGLEPENVKGLAETPLFLLGVLSYVATNKELLNEVEEKLCIGPAALVAASVDLTRRSKTSSSVDVLKAASAAPLWRPIYH